MTALLHNYAGIASVYDALGAAYSGGAIGRCKAAALAYIEPQHRVLFAGGGTGQEAVAAARTGADVTLVDRAWPMIRRARRRCALSEVEHVVEVLHEDIRDHRRSHHYDVVVANFFLNVFCEADVVSMLQHLLQQMQPNGRLIIGDFAPPDSYSQRRASIALQWAYHALPMGIFRVLTGSALHRIYDFSPFVDAVGASLIETRDFQAFRYGPAWYRSMAVMR
ncbi:MAG: class I SAM-dependent methyltransferase [Planctomycetota bacterium]